MFCIVTFTNEDESVDYIPEKWMIGRDKCFWPNEPIKVTRKWRTENCDPQKCWIQCPVRVLKWNIGWQLQGKNLLKRCTFLVTEKTARQLSKRAEMTSDLTDHEARIKRQPDRLMEDELMFF